MVSLLVSGMFDVGGVWSVTGSQVTQLDPTPTTGLLPTDTGLLRLRFSHDQCVLDRLRDGQVTDTWTIPGAAHPHGIVWHDGLLAIADTLHDQVLWINPDTGQIVRSWQATELGDTRHINSLAVHDGALLATCFGKFETNRGWWGKGAEKRGELFEVGTGRTVLEGLAAPHSPRRHANGWLIVNAFTATMDFYGDDGALRQSCVLGGWPVGLAVVDNLAWVGVGDSERQPNAMPPHGQTPGKIVAIDLATWQVVQEIPMPCAGIYDVIAS